MDRLVYTVEQTMIDLGLEEFLSVIESMPEDLVEKFNTMILWAIANNAPTEAIQVMIEHDLNCVVTNGPAYRYYYWDRSPEKWEKML